MGFSRNGLYISQHLGRLSYANWFQSETLHSTCLEMPRINSPILYLFWAILESLLSAPEPKAQVHYCEKIRYFTSFTNFVFCGLIWKTRWPPWLLIGWDIFDFSSETAERNSTKDVRKQDLNFLYQVCVFRADRKNKMAAPVSHWLRHFGFFLSNCWTEFNKTWQ